MNALAAAIKAAASAAPMPFTVNVEPVPGRVLHVDGDYCAYYCAGADDVDAGTARRNLLDRIEAAKRASGSTKVIVHLSTHDCTKGERFLVATVKPYQGQRNSGRKPDNWDMLRNFMETYEGTAFQVKLWPQREADDGMAYVCHAAASQHGLLHAVHTADKDMRMFAGLHIVWKTYQQVQVPLDTYELIGGDGEVYGHKWFWLQMLQGDAADNIPGLPGFPYVNAKGKDMIGKMGPATAEKALAPAENNLDACRIVAGLYESYYNEEWADRFVEQAALLWMRTDREAAIGNFLTLGVFGDEIKAAVRRMVLRVEQARANVEALAA